MNRLGKFTEQFLINFVNKVQKRTNYPDKTSLKISKVIVSLKSSKSELKKRIQMYRSTAILICQLVL